MARVPPYPAMVALHTISYSCRVNAAIMSIFLRLQKFYLQKSYYKLLIHVSICRFSLKFSYFMKERELNLKRF